MERVTAQREPKPSMLLMTRAIFGFNAARIDRNRVTHAETSQTPENRPTRRATPPSRRAQRVGTARDAAALPKRCRQPTTITKQATLHRCALEKTRKRCCGGSLKNSEKNALPGRRARAAASSKEMLRTTIILLLLLGHARAAPQNRPPRHWYEDNFRPAPWRCDEPRSRANVNLCFPLMIRCATTAAKM